jgi:hypothetical protein
MTRFKFNTYANKQDIKIRPKALINEIYNLFEDEIENISSFKDETSKIKLKSVNNIYKDIKKLLENYHFWNNICSYNFCCYQYRNPKNKDNEGKICGRRIDNKKSYDNNSNKYLCSEHDRNHRKYHSQHIKLKENEIQCININKDGSNCKYKSVLNNLCSKHNYYIYKINKHNIYDKIVFYKYYTDIKIELDILSCIDIDIYKKSNTEIKNNKVEKKDDLNINNKIENKLYNDVGFKINTENNKKLNKINLKDYYKSGDIKNNIMKLINNNNNIEFKKHEVKDYKEHILNKPKSNLPILNNCIPCFVNILNTNT